MISTYIYLKEIIVMEGKYIFKNFTTESGLMSFLNDEKISPAHVISIMF